MNRSRVRFSQVAPTGPRRRGGRLRPQRRRRPRPVDADNGEKVVYRHAEMSGDCHEVFGSPLSSSMKPARHALPRHAKQPPNVCAPLPGEERVLLDGYANRPVY